jgi:GntR family transcriptional regulator
MAQFGLDLALDRGSDVPLGTQLAWRLRAAIASGGLEPGDRLPAVRELAAAAGVNVNTVRAVYARLAEQGVVVSQHGRGTFVGARGGREPGLGPLAERAARDAQRHGVDPRELAAVLYARFDQLDAVEQPWLDEEADARRGLRAEIEALEHELAGLDPRLVPVEEPGRPRAAADGARLVSTRELEATRDALAARVSERQRKLRAARLGATTLPERALARERSFAWPELLAAPLLPKPEA